MMEIKNTDHSEESPKTFHVHLIWGIVCVVISIISLLAYKITIEEVRKTVNAAANATIVEANTAATASVQLAKDTAAASVKLAQDTADRALTESKNAAAALANFVKTAAEKFSSEQITTTFTSEIPVFASTCLGRLEVGTAEATETFSSQDTRMTAWMLNLGTTTTEIKVPVTYRYHVDLSEPWSLSVSEHNCFVKAPSLKPSLPTAIHTDRMEKKNYPGWARVFDSRKLMDELEKKITPSLGERAQKPEHLNKAREEARLVVARFVRAWLMRENQWRDEKLTSVTVRFEDESSSDAILQPTLTLNKEQLTPKR